MKLRKELILLSVISIVFLAGCTGGGDKSSSGSGFFISSFGAIPPTVESGIPITLTLTVKNAGEHDATNVKATLIGLPFPASNDVVLPTTLIKADPQLGLPEGDEQSAIWTVTTPLDKSTTTTYTANVRVVAGYSTTGEALIRTVGIDYFRTLTPGDQQRLQRGVISSQFTKGPLSVTILAPQPITQTGATIPVQIQVDNVGRGRVGDGTATNLDKITLSSTDLTGCQSTITLIEGKSGRTTCNLATNVGSGIGESRVRISLAYNYFVDASTSFILTKSLNPAAGQPIQPGIQPGQQPAVNPTATITANPIIAASAEGWYNKNFQVDFIYTAQAGATLTECKLTTPGRPISYTQDCSGKATFTKTDTITTADCADTSTCTITASAAAGGKQKEQSVSFKVDRSLPLLGEIGTDNVDQNTVILNKPTKYGLIATDATSGVKECKLSVAGEELTMDPVGATFQKTQSFSDASKTSFEVKITCKDRADNLAEKKKTYTLDKLAPGRSAPTANGGTASSSSPAAIPTGTTSVVIGLTTDEDSTCKYAIDAAGQTYDSLANTFTTTGAKSHSATITGLTAGTKEYNVMCTDGGNKNADKFIIKFTIA